MHILDAKEMRAWDDYTMQQEPIASIDLMERAASKCFDWLKGNNYLGRSFLIFCGPGNNGGDGYALARLLLGQGSDVNVYQLDGEKQPSADNLANQERLKAAGLSIHIIHQLSELPELTQENIIIDALYGMGLSKPLCGMDAEVATYLNNSGAEIISIDLPSGLFSDQSSCHNVTIRASHTLTFQTMKLGLLLAENAESFGEVHVLDIGLHPGFLRDKESPFELLSMDTVRSIHQPRNPFAHKGDHGHAALVAGSEGMMGAAILAARGCLRSGVGKLTCYIPRIGYNIMQQSVPEAMVKISGEEWITGHEEMLVHEAVGIGPGLGLHIKPDVFQDLLQSSTGPVVLDADALNLLAADPLSYSNIFPGSVLTPHPKEFDRIYGAHDNEFERIHKAVERAKKDHFVIVLKGHHTLIALPSGKAWFNSTGNAGMAKGGSGDVLTGLITGLMAQGYSSQQAAMLGVYLHGLAGDLAATELSQEAMIAGDLVNYLGKAFLKISAEGL